MSQRRYYTQEYAYQPNEDNQNVEGIYEPFFGSIRSIGFEVVHPQQSWKDQAERRIAQGSRETQEIIQNGYCFGNDESESSQYHVSAEPSRPVDNSVLL